MEIITTNLAVSDIKHNNKKDSNLRKNDKPQKLAPSKFAVKPKKYIFVFPMNELEKKFNSAFEIASAMTKVLPPDIMLHFYAYYKIGSDNSNLHMPSGSSELRNGFKLNALYQFKDVSKEEAQEKYIQLVEKYTNQKID